MVNGIIEEQSEASFNEFVKGIEEDRDSISNELDEATSVVKETERNRDQENLFVRGWNDFWDDLRELISGALDQIEKIRGKFDELVELLAKVLSPGNPFRLDELRQGWLTVINMLSNHVSSVGHYKDFPATFPMYWDGINAGMYRDASSRQKEAIQSVISNVNGLATEVENHQSQVVRNIVTAAGIMVADTTAIIGKLLHFGDPVGWFEILQTCMGIVEKVVGTIQALVQKYVSEAADAKKSIFAMQRNLANSSGYENGKWPMAVV